MALNPLNVSLDIASVPPAMAASSRPSRTASAALPIAIVLDAHAVTMQERSPSNPKCDAMMSTGVLGKWFQTSDGRECSMPFDTIVSRYRSVRSRSAVQAPSRTPMRDGSKPFDVRPLSSTASMAATSPNWSLRDHRRRCSGVRRGVRRSYGTSAAIRLRKPSVGNTVTSPIPHVPLSRFVQFSSRVRPSAVTMPIPVMATRRGVMAAAPRQPSGHEAEVRGHAASCSIAAATARRSRDFPTAATTAGRNCTGTSAAIRHAQAARCQPAWSRGPQP